MGWVGGEPDELDKMNRVKMAKQVSTICAYCSCGCGLICSVDKLTGKIFNIEGDADHPINEGTLCAKGAGFFDLTEANKHRLKKVLYRAPYATEWEEKDWDFAIPRIARLIKDTRDKEFITKNAKGELVNRCETIGHYGSSNVDNEECSFDPLLGFGWNGIGQYSACGKQCRHFECFSAIHEKFSILNVLKIISVASIRVA